MSDSNTQTLVKPAAREPALSAVEALAAVPEEDVWLASQKSPQSRRAYRRGYDPEKSASFFANC